MRVSDNALNILAAKTYSGIGRAWIVKRLRGNETATSIVTLLNRDARGDGPITQENFEGVKERIKGTISRLTGFSDGVVAIGDRDFPSHRGVVKAGQRPVALFYRGDLSLLNKENRNIAVIGLLNPDKDTEVFERKVVSKLVGFGATIVSGLALGCDTVAHKQALCSDGKTVAILPSPLDEVLPAGNKGLADEIVRNGGLLVTEYYERAKSKRELIARYQERDRLQALFSDCVILTASYAKNELGNDSGSRLAMEYAKSYSIPRSVMYDPVTDVGNSKYDLNRQLLSESGEVVIINRKSVDSAIEGILYNQPAPPHEPIGQAELFD